MLLTPETLVPLAVFLAITLGVWAVMSMVADRPVNAEERLKRVLNPTSRRPDAATLVRQQDRFQQKIARAANTMNIPINGTLAQYFVRAITFTPVIRSNPVLVNTVGPGPTVQSGKSLRLAGLR